MSKIREYPPSTLRNIDDDGGAGGSGAPTINVRNVDGGPLERC
jgi:hypothetical protein